MKIYNSIVSWIIKKRIHHIELFINYPHEVQDELRQHLIDKAKIPNLVKPTILIQ